MTALTEDRDSVRSDGILKNVGLAANAVIFLGAFVGLDADGYLVPVGDATHVRFLGVAEAAADNTGGADDALNVNVTLSGEYDAVASGLAAADLGAAAYGSDDQTIVTADGVEAPTNVTGVTLSAISDSNDGDYALAYVHAAVTLGWGGGTALDAVDGTFYLTATDGSRIKAVVVAASLPGSDKSDTITVAKNIKVGTIIGVVSATKARVKIGGEL